MKIPNIVFASMVVLGACMVFAGDEDRRARLDTNGDGVISHSELRASLEHPLRISHHQASHRATRQS